MNAIAQSRYSIEDDPFNICWIIITNTKSLSKSIQNDSFSTLIETSGNNIKNGQIRNTTVEFASDQSVELISDIIKTKLVNRKRKH